MTDRWMADIDPTDKHSQLIVKLFFNLAKKDEEGKVFCRCCEGYFRDNKGSSNLANHARNRNKEQVHERIRTQSAAFVIDPSIPSTPAPFTPLSTPMSASSPTTSSY